MGKRMGRSGQVELFERSKKPVIPIEPNHRLVQLTDQLDWIELEQIVEEIRRGKLKNAAGRPPHLRALTGAVLLMATRRMTYRDAEDQIRHYAPARYLCGLTETEWTPDFTTIQDFTELMGEDGLRRINQFAVGVAVAEKLADPRVMVADTTAQEAAIAWPNEMGLMAAFMTSMALASKRAGKALKKFGTKAAGKFKAAKEKVRRYRLFTKTKQARLALLKDMASLVSSVQNELAPALKNAAKERLHKYSLVARAKAQHLQDTMTKLLPQIRYWMRTGRVAVDKIINLHMPELYSIVRGKAGEGVEFGLTWGFRRLAGGYLLANVARDRRELHDSRFAVQAVREHIALFGKPPRGYAYDRGGYSMDNVKTLKDMGVKEVGLAPQGQAQWSVYGKVKDKLVRERAQVEGGIGAVKSGRYGFNRPAARSVKMMGACGQRAVLGFNLNKLVRELAGRQKMVLAG